MDTILLIDDALFCRELVGKALRQEGYDVLTAGDGREGLAVLKQNAVHLIILDNEMPIMDGMAFLRKLRANPSWEQLPVIMLTGSAQKDKVLRARQSGAADYILKAEFSLEKLLQRLRKWLPGSLAGGAAVRGAANLPGATKATKTASRSSTAAPLAPGARFSVAASLAPPRPSSTADSVASGATSITEASPAAGATFSAIALASPVSRGASARTARPVLTLSEQVIEAIDTIDDARTLGGVVTGVLAIANSPRGGLKEMVHVVQQDPVLSSRTLRLANSAKFASDRPPVTTLGDAVRHIGVGSVRNLAMSLGVFDTLSSGGTLGLGLIRCWAHALAVAGLMDRMSADGTTAPAVPKDAGVGHLVGLCHDLGEILLRQRFPEPFAEAEEAALSSGVSVLRVLPDVYGITYDEVVERLLTKLRVPATISQPIMEHARREAGKTTALATPISRMLSLADGYANGLLLASSVTATISPILLTDYPDVAAIDRDSLRPEVLATICAMANMAPAEEAELLRPLLPRQPLVLSYFRDRCLSAFDPIESALRAISRVQTVSPLSALNEQRAERSSVVAATPRLDSIPHSNAGNVEPGLNHASASIGLFLVGDTAQVDCRTDSSRVYHRYPISLHALNRFLEQRQVQQIAA